MQLLCELGAGADRMAGCELSASNARHGTIARVHSNCFSGFIHLVFFSGYARIVFWKTPHFHSISHALMTSSEPLSVRTNASSLCVCFTCATNMWILDGCTSRSDRCRLDPLQKYEQTTGERYYSALVEISLLTRILS